MKDDVSRKTRVVMSIPAMATAVELLKEAIIPLGVDPTGKKLVDYKEGYSDRTVAAKLAEMTGEDINDKHIQNVRTQIHGHLKHRTPMMRGGMMDQMKAQIETLQKRLAHLEEWATTPGNKPYVRPVSDLLDTWDD